MVTDASYDFWINSTGWNTCIGKETPLERATAQFRKDQFDAASSVGDQSLTGWWTRGQFSFHKGAGLKYYETLDGETVFNRFNDDLAVDPFAQPGELTLGAAFSSIYSAAAVIDAVPAGAVASGSTLALTSAGDLKVIPAAGGSTTAVGSGVYTGVTADDTYFYAAKGTSIYSEGNNPRVAASNFVTNAGPDGSPATGWTKTGGGTSTLPTVAGGTLPSGRVGYVQFSIAPADTEWTVKTTVSGLTVGNDYEFSIWLLMYSGEVDLGRTLTIFAGSQTGPSMSERGPVRQTVTFRATATSHDVGFTGSGGTTLGPGVFTWSSAMVTNAPTSLYYGDENTPGWAIGGGGYPVRAIGTSTELVALWSNELASNWAGVFWAKGRMFAVDTSGRWFAMAPGGQIAHDNDTFWRSLLTNSSTTPWNLTDSPGAVFISRGRNIWALVVEDNGLLPTLGVPVLAAQLPVGETISCIQHYLGYLVIGTSAGIRLAKVDDTTLAYGPLVVEGSCVANRIATRANSAYVPVLVDGDSALVELSFADTISDLINPYSKLYSLSGAGALPCGAVLVTGNTLRVFDETGVVKESGLATTGFLQTGYIRLGTLDNKAFRALKVKVAGTVGSIEVFTVKPDGTTTSVGTVAAGASSELDLTSALTSPLEYIALKFTLTGNGSAGPTLVGYQLKALPVPVRQRLMRVPLMLFDHETNRTGAKIGTSGSAWTRLAALEALEESNAVVTFEDKETGETGDAYLESIEVRRTASASRTKAEGFGGLVYVTLRKI